MKVWRFAGVDYNRGVTGAAQRACLPGLRDAHIPGTGEDMESRSPLLPAQTRDVISYEEDVFAWMYFDQVDRVLRYEAYVIGYTEGGQPGTLEMVIEEGILPPEEYPAVQALLTGTGAPSRNRHNGHHAAVQPQNGRHGSHPGPLASPLQRLSPADWRTLHEFFEQQEAELKRRHRLRWMHRLRALGYDVISCL